ncbi:MAG TPA: hypothetical protein VF077_12595 [Nitrospiraceae bacterium]
MQILTPLLLAADTGLYTFALVDEAGAGIDGATLQSLTLTYYDQATAAIINAREHQNVLNANDVTVTTIGTLPPWTTTVTWELQPEDTVIFHPESAWEVHIVQFRWTWAGGQRTKSHRVGIGVEQLRYTP